MNQTTNKELEALAAREDRIITSDNDLCELFDRLTFRDGVVNWNWRYRGNPFKYEDRHGWLIWVEFQRPDTQTGEVGWGRSRDEIVWQGSSESSVVKTCWLLAKLIVDHELMEAFQYEGFRVFDPHYTLGDLQLGQKIGSRKDMACPYMGDKEGQ